MAYRDIKAMEMEEISQGMMCILEDNRVTD